MSELAQKISFGAETVTEADTQGQPGLRVEAGDRGGNLYIETMRNDEELALSHTHSWGDLVLVTDEELSQDAGHPESAGTVIFKNPDGELWFQSNAIPGLANSCPVKISTLLEGSRHWVQDTNEGDDGGEYARYELLRRLVANPTTLDYLVNNAPFKTPRGRPQYFDPADCYFDPSEFYSS